VRAWFARLGVDVPTDDGLARETAVHELLTREATAALAGSAPALTRVVVAERPFDAALGDLGAGGVLRRRAARTRWSHAVDLGG
jgi:hypothetical protein